jgi:hypothetical protein
VLLDFWWDTERLWQLDLPVTEMPVERLTWQLTLPMWQIDGVPFQVSPAQVAANPDRYAAQYARTMAADTQFPLHMTWLSLNPWIGYASVRRGDTESAFRARRIGVVEALVHLCNGRHFRCNYLTPGRGPRRSSMSRIWCRWRDWCQ